MTFPPLAFLLVPVVLWRLYARVRRMVARQPSQLWRHWSGSLLMPLVLAGIGWLALPYEYSLIGWAAGLVCGTALAIWGLRLTRFERTPEGWFFTPNLHIGLFLSALLIARIVYRGVVLYEAGQLPGGPHAMQGIVPHVQIAHMLASNPLTLAIISLRLGYAAVFAMGLLRWRLAQKALSREQAQEPPQALPPPKD